MMRERRGGAQAETGCQETQDVFKGGNGKESFVDLAQERWTMGLSTRGRGKVLEFRRFSLAPSIGRDRNNIRFGRLGSNLASSM